MAAWQFQYGESPRDGLWYWRLVETDSGTVIATSDRGHRSAHDVMQEIGLLRHVGSIAPTEEVQHAFR
jgi:hypothetical protein